MALGANLSLRARRKTPKKGVGPTVGRAPQFTPPEVRGTPPRPSIGGKRSGDSQGYLEGLWAGCDQLRVAYLDELRPILGGLLACTGAAGYRAADRTSVYSEHRFTVCATHSSSRFENVDVIDTPSAVIRSTIWSSSPRWKDGLDQRKHDQVRAVYGLESVYRFHA